jgi:hypothetical protein
VTGADDRPVPALQVHVVSVLGGRAPTSDEAPRLSVEDPTPRGSEGTYIQAVRARAISDALLAFLELGQEDKVAGDSGRHASGEDRSSSVWRAC